MKDLRTARKSARQTQQDLEEKTSISQSDLSKFEVGTKLMSETVAERLARHLAGTSPSELLMSNKAQAFKRAQETGDRVGVLKAAESIVKYASRLPEDPKLDAMLDRLVDTAVKFAEDAGSVVSDEGYDQDPEESRDVLGRKVTKSSSTVSDDEDAYPLWKGHCGPGRTTDRYNDFDDDEGYDDFDEGRDGYGNRVAPLGEVS